jgi:hypothetical protein
MQLHSVTWIYWGHVAYFSPTSCIHVMVMLKHYSSHEYVDMLNTVEACGGSSHATEVLHGLQFPTYPRSLYIEQQLATRQLSEQWQIWIHSWGMSGLKDILVFVNVYIHPEASTFMSLLFYVMLHLWVIGAQCSEAAWWSHFQELRLCIYTSLTSGPQDSAFNP